MGSDSRAGALISRTDTMMLLSVNLQSQQVSLLSIPRDLYVEIPGYGRDRLNTALVHGANINDEDPVAGMEVAIQTIEQTFGVNIDHYVVVNLRTVEETIDSLGGVDMFVPYTISDPTYINWETGEPLYIPEGQNHFDGDTALRYVRTRNQDSDFARSGRQQQLLLALRQKALYLGVTEILARAPVIYQHVKSGVFTDLSLEDMVALAQVGSDIPIENIHTAVLNSDYVTSYLSEEGSHVLLLKPETVAPLIQEMFFDERGPETSPAATEPPGPEGMLETEE
jgi:LCP family protein required for cell wall assembly